MTQLLTAMVEDDFEYTYVDYVDDNQWEVSLITPDNKSLVARLTREDEPTVNEAVAAIVSHYADLVEVHKGDYLNYCRGTGLMDDKDIFDAHDQSDAWQDWDEQGQLLGKEPHRISRTQAAFRADVKAAKEFAALVGPKRLKEYEALIRQGQS